MARKRMLSPTIWEDPDFYNKTRGARLAFIGCVSNADDEGYFRGDYKSIRRTVYGFEDEEDSAWYEEMKGFKNLHFYEVDGEMFAHFTKWHEHQIQQKDRILKTTYPKTCSKCLASDKQPLKEVSKLSKKESKEPGPSLKKLREQWGTPNYRKTK